MTTETTAAASKSSKSKSICAVFCSLRFGEADRASEFFLVILPRRARSFATESSQCAFQLITSRTITYVSSITGRYQAPLNRRRTCFAGAQPLFRSRSEFTASSVARSSRTKGNQGRVRCSATSPLEAYVNLQNRLGRRSTRETQLRPPHAACRLTRGGCTTSVRPC